jgi:acyl transferase domain-containing protein/acyl carrier protein/SAM-dependent methyltransferase
VDKESQVDGSEIAIIGMAGRFPGASNLDIFWNNLRDGVESITALSDDELLAAGVDPAELRDPGYVKAAALLDQIEYFDAGFFGYTPFEAEVMDPQARLLLECSWEALEHAGYDPDRSGGAIGVYAGSKTNTYMFSLAGNPDLVKSVDFLQAVLGGDLAMLSTRISYKLNLKGPSYAVQTACSTSLVAVHLACQSLLINECRIALAGAVAINVPHKVGYQYQPGGILSPDGHCRPFDAEAQGTIFGSGVGMVVLKRLEDALHDGDTIHAIIRGTATNNDGAYKASFTAPSVEGQTNVIIDALAVAGIDADTISYVEAHGTGTALGDPIELLALTEAYRASTDKTQFCAIGSVKSNVGHLDAAAGMSSLIKTTLALKHRQIPPSINYSAPNPRIDFASSPFYVNDTLRDWQADALPRRAGVSSFGFGGTNAHVILEEAPEAEASDPPSRPWQLLLLSAKTASALDTATANLARQLQADPELNLADVAYTLQLGRKAFEQRRIVVCRDPQDAVAALTTLDPERVASAQLQQGAQPVIFMFPGQGAQYVGMGRDLYQQERVFRQAVDRCCALLRPQLGLDLRTLLYPSGDVDAATTQLTQTALAQPALFVIEYALAQLWQSWGIQPQALIGHSIGEYVAACLAGVFSLEDALLLVATRGRLMQALPPGAMLAVPLPEAELLPLVPAGVDLAAVNGPSQCVVAGPSDAIAAFEQQLAARGVESRRLHTSHAFHSAMMEPLLDEFAAAVRKVRLNPPQIAYVSNLSGTWISEAEATDPGYWSRQIRQPVRFAAGLATILERGDAVLLEVGPGTTLGTFARQQPTQPIALASLRHPRDQRADGAFLLTTLGKLWLAGVEIDWSLLYTERRHRIPLPTYPFERQRFWLDARPLPSAAHKPGASLLKQPHVADWLYQPIWQPSPLPANGDGLTEQPLSWLLFVDEHGLGLEIGERLRAAGHSVTGVQPSAAFRRISPEVYGIDPRSRADYERLITSLAAQKRAPQRIVHLWSVSDAQLDDALDRGFYSLLFLAQALGRQPAQIEVVTSHVQQVLGEDRLSPAKAAIGGPCLVIPQEYPQLRCRTIDVSLDERAALAELLLAEWRATTDDLAIAYRGGQRWAQHFERLDATQSAAPSGLRQQGVYLITGGLGGIGLTVAEYLARSVKAKLVLTGRSAFPARDEWDGWLATHDAMDRTSQRIRHIQTLESLGAEVLIISADVADQTQMQAAIAQTVERFGALHGVIHAAGVGRGAAFKAIHETGRAESSVHFDPKIYGLIALQEALAGRELDFCLLFSSLSSVLGGLGNVAYAAANRFMDAFARQQGGGWRSIDWDSWHQAEEGEQAIGATLVELAIQPEEGIAALDRILALQQPQIVVSTADLQSRLDQWVRLPAVDFAPAQSQAATAAIAVTNRGQLERKVTQIWQKVLGVPTINAHDNFFDLGGNSLSGMQLISELRRELNVTVDPVTLFAAPTISALVKQLSAEAEPAAAILPATRREQPGDEDGIAIVGLSGRWPGADSVEAFWQNLRDGVESISFFGDDELLAAGVAPAQLNDPRYIKARPVLHGVELFDAGFFGYSPREAELMDPQHRIFLECAFAALEDAGYAAEQGHGPIGVYAGASLSTYLFNLYSNAELLQNVDPLQTIIGNASDSLTTSVSYKLNLKGPSLAVQTFCSTSLVAVHLACESLKRGECELALAGGVSVLVPQQSGYLYQEDGILSPDGHCRPFDAEAQGTLFGNGVGVVVLKRLSAAIRDGDQIHAVIKGSAINNDGSLKVGYTAPSVEGQAEVIADALASAGVTPDTISYVEAHGTGTNLGDPIEVAALTKAFRGGTDKTGYCALGSVKGNVGHLDRAAGVTALIKSVLALKHRQIPPSLHFTQPNPKIDFAASPFYVNTALREWQTEDGTPRRAGVSALGFGGTNAHVIVEEAPPLPESGDGRPWQLLLLSAKTETALENSSANLASYLRSHHEHSLADIAYTLQAGRKSFAHRRAIVCRDRDEALALLEGQEPQRVLTGFDERAERPVAFLFSGQGAQYVNMGRDLYEQERVFRETVDLCCDLVIQHLDLDLRELLYPADERIEAATEQLTQTAYAQPALFVIEYALAQLWRSWGVRPAALIGHSIGEYVAATLAGVWTLADALGIVAARGRLMQSMPEGSMLGVPLPESEIVPLLHQAGTRELSLAAINAPNQCVVAGPSTAIAALEEQLAGRGVESRRLHTSHAFHSAMMEPIVGSFADLVGRIELHPPQMPFISCVSGSWITADEATDPGYWARQIRQPVRFAEGLSALLADETLALLEVGPGQTLSALARRQLAQPNERIVLASTRHPQESQPDQALILTTLGKLWLAGVEIDWRGFAADEIRRRVSLPTYPFERQRYWIEAQGTAQAAHSQLAAQKNPSLDEWLYVPGWKRAPLPKANDTLAAQPGRWLVFLDQHGLGLELIDRLQAARHEVITVRLGQRFEQQDERSFMLDPRQAESYDALLQRLAAADALPGRIVHLWSVTGDELAADDASFEALQLRGCYSLLYLAQALAQYPTTEPIGIWLVSNDLHEVNGDESIVPAKATLLGPSKAISEHYPQMICRSVDLRLGSDPRRLAEQLLAEISRESSDLVVAYRGKHRWVPSVEPVTLDERAAEVQAGGVYLISGGLSEKGLSFAEHLAQSAQAKLALVESEALPQRSEWPQWLAAQIDPQSDSFKQQAAKVQPRGRIELLLAQERAALQDREQAIIAELGLSSPPDGLAEAVDALCGSYVYRYFAQNIDATPGARYTREELKRKLRILPKFDKFYAYLLHVLIEDGVVTAENDTISFRRQPEAIPQPEQLKAELDRRYPGATDSFWALEHCARHYGAALSGDVEAVSVLYPNGSSEMLLEVTESQSRYSNVAVYRTLIGSLIRRAQRADGPPLRILEIGAGDGKLTWELVDELKDCNITYHFTDIGKSFVLNAEKHAAQRGLDFMRFGVLDVAKDPVAQGFDKYAFDIILALDVVHATERIADTMQQLGRLLAPDGLMCILEPTKTQRWVSLIWGLAEGWWYFSDSEIRALSPLLTPERWEWVLAEGGFASVDVLPQRPELRADADHSLILVQQPTTIDTADYQQWIAARIQRERQQIQRRIAQVQALEALGSEVLLLDTNPSDPSQMQAAVTRTIEHFGALHGVIHAAEPDAASLPTIHDPVTAWQAHLDQQVASLRALDDALNGRSPELALLTAPLASFDGSDAAGRTLGLWLNAYAQRSQNSGTRWTAVNWDRWQTQGDGWISAGEGGAALGRLLTLDAAQIIVSPRPLAALADDWSSLAAIQAARQASREAAAALHPRPALTTEYVAPSSEIEQQIAALWAEVLGIAQVGIHDNFFDLGGDSLMATQLSSRLRDSMQIDLPVRKFFEAPTVAGLAQAIAEIKAQQDEQDQLEILRMLEELSEEDLLAEMAKRNLLAS